ncbi:MAG: S1/P1 nuclease [Croceitalea sp.]|nr:S1/P1 nuclease [Croceitalea sp.]
MRFLLILFLALPTICSANAIWGKTGHRVTGQIAEKHLTRKAKKAINKLLDGHSLAFVSTYADEIKSDRAYSSYSPWHYVNYALGTRYQDASKSEFGDIVMAIETCTNVLKNPNSSQEDKIFHLKLLVHFIGDLHQPMHAGRSADKGGNDIQLQWFDQGTNLHRVWDSNLIDYYNMGYVELANELDRSIDKKERKQLQQGDVYDWLDESHEFAATIYSSVEVGEKLGYSYAYEYNGLVFSQLQKGGFRLAKVLNDIFS